MEKPLEQIYQHLQRLIGLHRQLLDVVRVEREALIQAEVIGIQEATLAKQAAIEAIQRAETERLKSIAELAILWKQPVRELTLGVIITRLEPFDQRQAEQFRSAQATMNLLIRQASEQNEDNRALVSRSLDHINQMKQNVLGESSPQAGTYNQQGAKNRGSGASRLISKEA